MKILYGEGNFLEQGHQISAYPASVGGEAILPIEKYVSEHNPDVKQCVFNMFAENVNFEVIPPQLGDVIWTQTSGNKWFAHCIIFDSNEYINYDALELCMKSIKSKAIELEHDQICMPLRWFKPNEQTMNWIRTYEVIENVLSEEDDVDVHGKYQVFAYDPDSKFVRDLMESLPGAKRAFYADVQIRFRNL